MTAPTANVALRRAMASYLGCRVEEITDAVVEWDEGGVSVDPTYGDESYTAPTFRVLVRLAGDRYEWSAHEVPVALTFTALLRAMLEVTDPGPEVGQ